MARYRASRLSPLALAAIAVAASPVASADRKHPAPIEFKSAGQGSSLNQTLPAQSLQATPRPDSGATHDSWRGPVTHTGAVSLPTERQRVEFYHPANKNSQAQQSRQYASVDNQPRATTPQGPTRLWPAESTASPLDASKTPAVQTLTLGPRTQSEPVQQVSKTLSPKASGVTHEERGLASWYGEDFDGQPTANGEIFDVDAMTAAHRTLPLPSLVQVVNEDNGKEVVVRVNDRGPFAEGRIIDLSRRAASALGISGQDAAPVVVRYLGPAPAIPAVQQVADAGQTQTFRADAASQRMSRPDLYGDVLLGAAEPSLGVPDPGQQMASPAARTSSNSAVRREPMPALNASATPSVRRVSQSGVSFPPSASSESGIYLQVGAFADIGNAQSRHAQVKGMFPVKVEDVELNGASYFRVLVGPFATRDEAERARIDFRLYGISESFITQR